MLSGRRNYPKVIILPSCSLSDCEVLDLASDSVVKLEYLYIDYENRQKKLEPKSVLLTIGMQILSSIFPDPSVRNQFADFLYCGGRFRSHSIAVQRRSEDVD